MQAPALFILALAMGLCPVGHAKDDRINSTPVDQTLALRVGPLSISQYLIEKNYNLFLGEKGEAPGIGPSLEERISWFRLYLAKSIVVAQALAAGYGDNPEVVRRVAQMERYMLTKAQGPLYSSLYDSRPISDDRLRSLFEESGRVLRMTGIRIPTHDVAGFHGADWGSTPALVRLQRLLGTAPGSVIFDGSSSWPYRPFIEIESALSAAKPNSWIEQQYGDEEFIVYVRSVDQRQLPPFSEVAAGFREVVRQRDRALVRATRRMQLLHASSFAFHPDVASQVLLAMGRLPHQRVALPSATSMPCLKSPLAAFTENGVPLKITPVDWSDYFNSQLIRRTPADTLSMEESVKAMVVEELDFSESKRRGLDRTPQFEEDRRNFRYNQVLDVFERDFVAPKLRVSDEEIADYYFGHPGGFVRDTEARVQLLAFEDAEGARRWMKGKVPVDTPSSDLGHLGGLKSCADVNVSIDHPIPGFEALTQAILSSAIGRVFGPISSPAGVTVVVKRSAKRTLLPLGQVERGIRAKLARQKLDNCEIDLARDWVTQFKVEDRIPYDAFGLPKSVGDSLVSGTILPESPPAGG